MKKLLLTIALAVAGSGGLISSAQAHPGHHCGGFYWGGCFERPYCGGYYDGCYNYDDCYDWYFYRHDDHREHRR